MEKITPILQSEAAECGLACLAMIANYHGYKIDLNSLRQQHPQTLKGIDLYQLTQIADQINLSGRGLQLELADLPKLTLPCVLHWDMNHFVVLTKVTASQVEILDPARGRRTLSLEECSQHFTGIALELTPTSDFKPEDKRVRIRLKELWKNTTGLVPALLQLSTLAVFLEIFALASPYYMQLVIDEVVITYDHDLLSVLALGFGFLVVFKVVTTWLRDFISLHLSINVSQQLSFNLFRHLMRLPQDYFAKRHIGDVVSRFSSLDHIQHMMTNNLVAALIDGVMSIATLVMIFLYSPKLAWIVCASIAIYFIVRMSLYPAMRRLTEERLVAAAKEDSNFIENIRGIQTIKLAGIESKRQSLWQNFYIDAQNLLFKTERLSIYYRLSNLLLFGIENVLVIYFAAQLILDPQPDYLFTVGMLTAFMAYKERLTTSLSSLIDKFIEFKMIRLHLERLSDIALTEPEKHLDGTQQVGIQGHLRVEDLHYQYASTEPDLFKGLSLEVAAGESVAIVGPSGCGKSTLIKVLLGLYQPTGGSIRVDGVDVEHIGKRTYRKHIASVMQDDELLSGSLAQNIAQFDPAMDMNRVEECARLASIDEDIRAMPMGYNSLVGDMGTTLSGGQKQRVLMARALYRAPKILFLDEATSHLDVASERRVNKAVSKLNISRIMIAHRPETIAMADRVLEMNDGVLVDKTSEFK